MLVSQLSGVALDYWTARALADVIKEIRFNEDGQVMAVATGDSGQLPDGIFTPSVSWTALGPVIEQVTQLDFRIFAPFTPDADDGTVHCTARFGDDTTPSEGRGNSRRIALARCFIAARLGAEVDDDFPRTPHRPRDGMAATGRTTTQTVTDTLPRIDETPDPNGAIGDIKSLPRSG